MVGEGGGEVQGLRIELCKLAAAGAIAGAALIAQSTCGSQKELERAASAKTGGDPYRGQAAIRQYGCATCHTIPGLGGADALVGPSLQHIASRTHLGGVLPNTPDNLVRWIQDPTQFDPLTAMPKLYVTERDARDIASYLYTLK